jgi:hypothetical protein
MVSHMLVLDSVVLKEWPSFRNKPQPKEHLETSSYLVKDVVHLKTIEESVSYLQDKNWAH